MKTALFVESPPSHESPSPEHVFTVEDHNQAYGIWYTSGIKNKILMHIDAHIDFAVFAQSNPFDLLQSRNLEEFKGLIKSTSAWNPSPSARSKIPHIGNYINPAIKEGMIQKFYWVTPDDFLNKKRKLNILKKLLLKIIKETHQPQTEVVVQDRKIFTKFFGIEVIVCSLADLPNITEAVLLDIDTDFLVTHFRTHNNPTLLQIEKNLPWMWPQELVGILRDKSIKADLTTIAYSVNGYFTPFKFKYLGDELKMLLGDGQVDEKTIKSMELRRKAMVAWYQGLLEEAVEYLNQAIRLKPEEASNYYNLALLQWKRGLRETAAIYYQKAVLIDRSYRSEFNNLGQIYKRIGQYKKMEDEYKKMLILDPQDSYAHTGLGEVLLLKKDMQGAKGEFEKALYLEPRNYTARYLLSTIYLKEKSYPEALRILNEIIKENPGYTDAYLSLGRFYMQQGNLEEATKNYKLALRLGFLSSALYIRLGILYIKKRRFLKMVKFFIKAVRLFPLEIMDAINGYCARLKLFKSSKVVNV
jgi:tetratricopeptide (TPR) repeat protein